MNFKPNRFVLKIACLIFVLLFAHQSHSASFDTSYARILQQRIEYLKTVYNLVGISAAADVPGQGLWLGTAGISHVNNNMTSDMVFDVGSITKNFVASLMLQLIEADSLGLNDSIGTWLPEYPNINSKITIKQLLNHTSGIYNFTDNQAWANAVNSNPYRVWTLEEIVQGYILTPYFPPGAGWHYSNTNYTLLTMIIRKITNSDLAPLFHERFFTPLALNEAFVEMGDTITAPFAHNWVLSGSQLIDAYGYPRTAFVSSAFGPGGVVTRPENMIRWLKALYGGQIISNSMLDTMLTFVNATVAGGNGYGLGTIRYNVGGKICWGHAGNSFGHSSIAMHYKQGGITISVMMNKDLNTGGVAIDFMNTVINNNPLAIIPISTKLPKTYSLEQNYPNPFNPETRIKFQIPARSDVKVKIFDITGKLIRTMVDENVNAGIYEMKWDASGEPSGVYFYRIEAGSFSQTKKMILLK